MSKFKLFLDAFFPKKEKITTKERFYYYDVRRWEDFRYNLIFAKNNILYEDDKILVAARNYKGTLLKFILVQDFDYFLSLDLSNDFLIEQNKDKELKYSFDINDLNLNKQVVVTIFKHDNEETKEYAKKHTFATDNQYNACLTYSEEVCILNLYPKIRNFGKLYHEYQTAMYKDLGSHDREVM